MAKLLHNDLTVINESWSIPIILLLEREGTSRFSVLKRSLKGIESRSLSRALSALLSASLIERAIVNSKPPAVYYSLSGKGESLVPIILDLFEWKNRYNHG